MAGPVVFHSDYRRYFSDAYAARSARNPAYSLRAFARDLKLAVSTLTEIMQGRYGLSRERAVQVGHRLGLNADESLHLADLMAVKNARSPIDREHASERIRDRLSRGVPPGTIDAIQAVSGWYHAAILQLAEVRGFRADPGWIGERLGISEAVVVEAIDRLKRLDLVETRNGKLRKKAELSTVAASLPESVERKANRHALDQAAVALELGDPERNAFSTSLIAVSEADLSAAREELARFRRDFEARFAGAPGEKDAVYCLSTQFFALSRRV